MESFDLKNVWNALTTMERETIIDAAKDSQGVSWGHYSSVVKGILLSASSAGRVDLSYRDPLFWNAADVLREQGIAEAALRQQKAKLDAETPAEVDESSYPAYVQENIAYFRENLGRLLYDEVQSASGGPLRLHPTDYYANQRVNEIFQQFTENGYADLVAKLKREQVRWRRVNLLLLTEPFPAADEDTAAPKHPELDQFADEITAASDSVNVKPSMSAIEKLVLQAAEPPVWEFTYTPAWLQTANDKLETLRQDIGAEANLIKSTFVPKCISAVASNYANLTCELSSMRAALRLFSRVVEYDSDYKKLVRDQLAAIAASSSGVWFYNDPVIECGN